MGLEGKELEELYLRQYAPLIQYIFQSKNPAEVINEIGYSNHVVQIFIKN